MKQEQEVMQIIKTRLRLSDESQDALIETYVKEIGRRILHYCKRRDVPNSLNWVWASMVIDSLRVEHPDDFGGESISAMNVKIGDTSVSPADAGGATSTNKSSIEKIVMNYVADLNRYRRLRW